MKNELNIYIEEKELYLRITPCLTNVSSYGHYSERNWLLITKTQDNQNQEKQTIQGISSPPYLPLKFHWWPLLKLVSQI